MTPASEQAIRWVGQTRAAPPGRATESDERRALYGSSLQQFEEMISAAFVVGPATKPLQLYYALSQAGRAILAAWADEVEVRHHGLTQGHEDGIAELTIKPRADGMFPAVAKATGSEPLSAPVELGGLWAAIPDAPPIPSGRWPTALYAEPEPDRLWESGIGQRNLFAENRRIVVFPDGTAPRGDDALRPYPVASGASFGPHIVGTGQLPLIATRRGLGYTVSWQSAPSIPVYRFEGEQWLVPVVGTNEDNLSPLMLWWGLLFGLSILARYEPARWVSSLSVDASSLAVPLETLMATAFEAVPHLVGDALVGQPWLPHRP